MAQHKSRTIEPADAQRLQLTLDQWSAESPTGARTRALVTLAHASALFLQEALDLRLAQVLDLSSRRRRWIVRAPFHVTIDGAPAVVPEQAGHALQVWIAEAVQTSKDYRAPIPWPPPPHWPLFFLLQGSRNPVPLNARTAQEHFARVQQRAQLARRYRFQDLRHDALVAFGARTRNAAMVCAFGRLRDLRSALRYLPASSPPAIADLALLAVRGDSWPLPTGD